MALTAAQRVEALKEAIDAKISGGAVKALTFPDGKSLQNMTLEELEKSLVFWEGRAAEDAAAAASPRGLRINSIRLGGTP
jgi:hypothetical protein